MTKFFHPRRLLSCGAVLLCLFGGPRLAVAQALDIPKSIQVPAQPLGDALRLLAKQADVQVLFAPRLVEGRTAPAVAGKFTTREALDRLLSGTNLAALEQSPGVIIVLKRAPRADRGSPKVPAIPAVTVAAVDIPTDTELQEVRVTAQRREERVQDVPISVSAYSRTVLDAQGARGIDDLARITPGVTFVRGANNNSESSDIAIRGIGSNAGAATTGVYIDDTPIQTRHLSFPSFNTYPALFDLERVEVLRGPQGTLFGAGSEGGTVRFLAPEPSLDARSTYVRSEIAATSHGAPVYEIGAATGGPIDTGTLGFRASASYRREGGYVDRVDWHTGRTVDDASNSSATTTARLALKWAATDTLSIAPSVYYQKRDVDDTAAWWSPRPGNPDPTNGQFDNPLRNGNAVAQPSTDQFLLPALKVGWNLGSMQLISNTSYFKRDQSATTDYTQYDRAIFLGNPYPRAGAQGLGFWGDHQRNWTQELRLQSTDAGARVAWTAGLFYQRAKETTSQQVFDPDLLDDLGMSPDYGDGFIYVEDPRVGVDRQIAVFGQADVRFAERFTFTLGVRYAHARFEGSTFYPETLVVGPEVSSTGTQTERPVTPKFGLKYELSADSLVYATAAKGFRIGGTNAKVGQFCYGGLDSALGQVGLSDVPPTYNSDSLWSYELGMKNSLAQNRLVLNASAYYVKWRDIQQNVPLTACGFQYTGNLGEASSKGFDLQASLKVNHALSLGGAFSYTDAQFTKTVELASSVQSIVQKGDHLGGAPWTLAAFGELDLPLEGVETYVRADYQYSANQNDVVPNQNPLNGGYALWFPSVTSQSFASLRAGVKHRGIDVSVFAQNLFDTQPRLSEAQDIGAANGGTPLFYVISWRPRTVGVTATYHY